MELSSLNINKILVFYLNKAFLIFLKTEPCTFQLKHEKLKKSTPGKFFILQEKKKLKNFLCCLKRKVFYIFAKGNPETFFYNSENRTFRAQKMKKTHLVRLLSVFHHCFFRCYHFTIDL